MFNNTTNYPQDLNPNSEESLKSDNKTGIIWIYWAKAIGIFLVLMGHSDTPHFIRSWIYSFHMPLFFFLSGYLTMNKHTIAFGQYIKKYAYSLLMPYFCLGLIAYLVWFLKNLVHPGVELDSIAMWEPLVNMLYATGIPVFRLVHSSSLWFLPALFSVFAIHWIVRKFCAGDVSYCLVSLVLYFAGYYSFQISSFRLPFGIENAMIGFLFFAVGNVAHKWNISFTIKISFILGILCLSLQFLFLYFQKWPIASVLSGQLWRPVAFIPTAMFGICGLIGIIKMLPGIPAVVTISKNTLTIFTLETPVRLIIGGILYVLHIEFQSDAAKWTYGLVSSVIVLVCLSVFADILRRFCPAALGERKVPPLPMKSKT